MASIEESIGANIEALRTSMGISQAELGRRLDYYLGNPWSRQAVSAAARGGRAFTAMELIALAAELGSTLPQLLQAAESIDLPSGNSMKPEALAAVLAGDDDNSQMRLRVLQALNILERSHRDIASRASAQALVIANARAALGGDDQAQLNKLDSDPVAARYLAVLKPIVDEWSRPAARTRPLRNLRETLEGHDG